MKQTLLFMGVILVVSSCGERSIESPAHAYYSIPYGNIPGTVIHAKQKSPPNAEYFHEYIAERDYVIEVPGVKTISLLGSMVWDIADAIIAAAGNGFPEPDLGYLQEAVDVVRRQDYTGPYMYNRELEGAGMYIEYCMNNGAPKVIELLERGPRLACGLGVGSSLDDVYALFPYPIINWEYPGGMKDPDKRDTFPSFYRLQCFDVESSGRNAAGRYVSTSLSVYYNHDDTIVAISIENDI